jgi:hypothetical protein
MYGGTVILGLDARGNWNGNRIPRFIVLLPLLERFSGIVGLLSYYPIQLF